MRGVERDKGYQQTEEKRLEATVYRSYKANAVFKEMEEIISINEKGEWKQAYEIEETRK